ncbi:MAG: cadmium-translocating P-type ATPase, partial [Acinetobacter sp.]|nr:cadmium-translocating P-type ATPase [Acinetobacter sp.]
MVDREELKKAMAIGSCCSNAFCGPDEAGEKTQEEVNPQTKTVFLCGATLALAYAVSRLIPDITTIAFAIALTISLLPVAIRAVRNALGGNLFSIEFLMTVAAIGAYFIGAVEEAAMVVLLFLIGELLEGVATRKASESIRGLAKLIPKTAWVQRNGDFIELSASELVIDDLILVRPGDRIAADGEITSGESAINEAPVTGESVPKQKGAGDTVFAGTINGDAVIYVRVTASAQDNTITRIIKLVEEAQESKAPTERFIAKFSRYYTPCVMFLAGLVMIVPPLAMQADWQEWIYKGLAILLIGCPCALVISTPAAVAAGLSAGARKGLLMKGGAVLETFRKVTHVALDKTGTLTEGKPVVTDIVALEGEEAEVLSLAAAIEAGSSHPLALAIIAHTNSLKIRIPTANDAKALAGKGVSGIVEGKMVLLLSPKAAGEIKPLSTVDLEAIVRLNDQGKTVSVLMADDRHLGLIAIRDEPRADAVVGIAALTDAGIATLMLTGDNERTAQAIGQKLGNTEVHAQMLPDEKQKVVAALQAKGYVVAKVGDGINDAPALAAADVGIAMGGGTDVALETADAAVLHGRVLDVSNMINLSHSVMR